MLAGTVRPRFGSGLDAEITFALSIAYKHFYDVSDGAKLYLASLGFEFKDDLVYKFERPGCRGRYAGFRDPLVRPVHLQPA
jgi:hypothetical protein